MKSKWLIRNNSEKLIIFFNGWSLDENIVKHIKTSTYDVLMFYDYENFDIEQDVFVKIKKYNQINIIAWSFGVWACGEVIQKFDNLKNVIAINGTFMPIDDNFGIPTKIFNLTLANLSDKTYPRFFANMFLNPEKKYKDGMPKRYIYNQKQELIRIKELYSAQNASKKFEYFNKVFISKNDKIIPANNQIKFWTQNSSSHIFELNEGHCIFNDYNTWDELINYE